MIHASDSDPSLISAAERSEARFIKLVYLYQLTCGRGHGHQDREESKSELHLEWGMDRLVLDLSSIESVKKFNFETQRTESNGGIL